MTAAIALGLLWFLLFLASHIALFHGLVLQHHFRAISILLMVATVGTCVSVWLIADVTAWNVSTTMSAMVAIVVLLSLFILYMPFYYSISASLSIQTMIAIHRDGDADIRELENRCASESVVSKRLQIMAANGYLIPDGMEYRLTRKGILVARFFRQLKALWQLGPGG